MPPRAWFGIPSRFSLPHLLWQTCPPLVPVTKNPGDFRSFDLPCIDWRE